MIPTRGVTFTTSLLVAADDSMEAGAVAYLLLARKHPEHARSARLVSCAPEKWLDGRWNVRFALPTMTVAEAMGVGE